MRMAREDNIESIEQAHNQRDLTYSIHPGERITELFSEHQRKNSPPAIQLSSTGNLTFTSSSRNSSTNQTGDLEKRKIRRDAKNRRAEEKNVKNVIKIEHSENYDIDSVLKQLGEDNSNEEASSSSGGKMKKAKAERKRSNNGAKKKESKEESSATEEADEDDDEEEERQQQDREEDSNEQLTVKSETELKRQTSRSNEELFTPVKVKRKNKAAAKAPMAFKAKDDSGHNYSSSSSASSTASSSAWAATRPDRAQKGYNLRRKSALQPSASFDTMKSTASSVASDRDLQEAKDQLDLAADFPPLFPPLPLAWGAKKACSDLTSSSSSSFSAVIDASDDQRPPPDVTVVREKMNQQCTTGLPDIAAHAPILANMTNSSGVSSNAGDLTPPQTMSENEVLDCYDIDDDDVDQKDIPAVVILNNNNNNTKFVEDSEVVEFGFEVNVLDFLKTKNQLDADDEAIVSFGQSLVHAVDTPESGIDSDLVNNNNFYKVEEAVKVPNYAQVVQFVAKSWKKIERELKQGKAQRYY